LGSFLNNQPAETQKIPRISSATAERRISIPTPAKYLFVVHPKARLKCPKNQASGPREVFFCGFRISVASAGLSDSALNAEISTDAAMVRANCR